MKMITANITIARAASPTQFRINRCGILWGYLDGEPTTFTPSGRSRYIPTANGVNEVFSGQGQSIRSHSKEWELWEIIRLPANHPVREAYRDPEGLRFAIKD
jgi:hypothetical protein